MNKLLIVLFCVSVLFYSCKTNEFKVDVSNIKVDLNFERFDKELFQINTDSIYTYLPGLQQKYGVFLDLYFYKIIGVGSPNEIDFIPNLKEFKNYCESSGITKYVNNTFPTTDTLKNELTGAFKHYKYYFPDRYVPKIFVCVSAVGLSVFTTDSIIGISLDKYLGADCMIYNQLGQDKYIQAKMDKNMAVVDCMRAWCMGEFPINDSINTLLSNMIYEGRIQYFLDATLPEINDTLKWGYSYQQYRWAEKFEKNIWDYLVETKPESEDNTILFSNKTLDIKTFTGEAPFTTPFHNISAPRAATYVGYKIVQSFMKNNENYTLADLMKITDYNQIYSASKYNP